MFENSVAQQPSPQTSRSNQPGARRSSANSASADSPSSGGQQRLKNAINLGKAVGAKVNDLLRRKEPSHLGDIGVTEVNKNVATAWSSTNQLAAAANSHISFDCFPRLDPPPPGKKRHPRALKTTQDMMISSDPVVSSPDAADTPPFLPPPEKMTPTPKEEVRNEEQQLEEEDESTDVTPSSVPAEDKAETDSEAGTDCRADGVTAGGPEEGSAEGDVEEEEHRQQPQLSVPDLINKDPPVESRTKPCDVWQKASGPDSRLASTPRSDKTPHRISLGEEVLLGNGKDNGCEEAEPHPDLLSFE